MMVNILSIETPCPLYDREPGLLKNFVKKLWTYNPPELRHDLMIVPGFIV